MPELGDLVPRRCHAHGDWLIPVTCPAPTQIRQLCLTAKEIFMSQPNLLELEAPIKICGGCGAVAE